VGKYVLFEDARVPTNPRICPACDSVESRVIEVRYHAPLNELIRTRLCTKCRNLWKTQEITLFGTSARGESRYITPAPEEDIK
jgi:hypothetical protein